MSPDPKEGSRGKKESSSHDVKGNIGVASGKVQGGTETALEMAEGYARVFDPYWANARAFLDYLSDRGMIQRDIESARIGQFALATGSLIIADMKMLQSMWSLPGIQKVIANAVAATPVVEEPPAGNRKERRANPVPKPKPPAISDELKLTMEVLPHLPHSGHLHIITDDFAVWAAADEGSLVGLMSDLVLKHGAKIAGQWSMLGILDALPFESDQMLSPLELALLWQIVLDGFGDEFVTVRASLGRRHCEEVEYGLPDGWHGRLWRWPCDSFFSVPLL